MVHKLIGSMKELFRSGEGVHFIIMHYSSLSCSISTIAYGNSMRTCAEDLIKFGTNISTTESLLGEPVGVLSSHIRLLWQPGGGWDVLNKLDFVYV